MTSPLVPLASNDLLCSSRFGSERFREELNGSSSVVGKIGFVIATHIRDLLNKFAEIPKPYSFEVCEYFNVRLPSPSHDDFGIIAIGITVFAKFSLYLRQVELAINEIA